MLTASILTQIFRCATVVAFGIVAVSRMGTAQVQAAKLMGSIVDSESGRALAARITILDAAGKAYFPTSAAPQGSAVRYQRQHGGNPRAVENHSTVSAHPFQIDLPEGGYRLTIEHGKEYQPLHTNLTVHGETEVRASFALRRFVDMPGMGWFSGDTHVHRDPAEIPNVQLAEDVNVVLPVVHWTTSDAVAPSKGPRNFKIVDESGLVRSDATHVFHPLNSEYEIFSTGGTNHTSGAIVIANHKVPFDIPAFPLKRVAEAAHAQGALIDLEKHNWPWSMAVVPIVKPDLFELANNHLWQTEFAVRQWALPAPAYMGLPQGGLDSERDWALYGFQTYYALLNCGFQISPTAGTGNGVHPVPLGFGRVYVQLVGGFDYDAWMKGLKAGRSFVTTGPLLLASIDGQPPGARFQLDGKVERTIKVRVIIFSPDPVSKVELIRNGELVQENAGEVPMSKSVANVLFERIRVKDPTWLAVRCWTVPEPGRVRFAHTAPFYFDVPGRKLSPTRAQADYLRSRTREELNRSRSRLPAEAVAEYEEALRFYEALVPTAKQ